MAALAGTLLGCSGGGGSDGGKETKFIDYITPGKVPEPEKADPTLFPTQYKTAIVEFMRTWTENPGRVKDATIAQPVLRPVGNSQLYVTCVRYKPWGTNQFLEERTITVLFLTGRVSQVLPEDPQICRGLSYQRYVELDQMGPPQAR